MIRQNNSGRLNLTVYPKKILKHYEKTERKAFEIFNKTVCKEKSGHYSVGLLWKNEKTKLPYNRQIAVSRLKTLENKFRKESEFRQKYQRIIESYLKNGYATKLNTKLHNENKEIVDYIPYHGLKMKTSWKNLLKWPDYLSKLISILIKF